MKESIRAKHEANTTVETPSHSAAAASLKLNINQWALDDRPREKLMKLGAQALSNAELLAILIGSGSPQESAVDLMKRVLNDCNNNLNTLGKRSANELMKYKGVGEAKAIALLAACELGKRRQREKAEERQSLHSAEAIYELMHPQLQDLDVEEAWLLLLNRNYQLIRSERISRGGISETAVDIRLIIKQALLNNATVIAFCHNHPSGNPSPSNEDNRLTEQIRKACEYMRIYFLDHIIVTDGHYFSYREEGKL